MHRPRQRGPNPACGKSSRNSNSAGAFLSPLHLRRTGHFHKSQYQSQLSQIHIRKLIIVSRSVIWPINCGRIAPNCIVNAKGYAEAAILHCTQLSAMA